MNDMPQLEENCAAADASTPGCMTIDDLAAIEVVRDELAKNYKVGCTGCNYCMPCPKGINIPAVFSAYNESYSLGWYSGVFHYLTSVGAGRPNPHLASDCIACGACAKKCPQHIDIPTELAAARKRVEPLVMGDIVRLIGKVTPVM
jgi:predicted aldo/keto reductase-like oxidoreductase